MMDARISQRRETVIRRLRLWIQGLEDLLLDAYMGCRDLNKSEGFEALCFEKSQNEDFISF